MKKKNSIFNLGLYREGLRRLRIPGGIFLAVMVLEALLIPIMNVVNINEAISDGIRFYQVSIEATEAHPFIYLTFLVMAPILAWTAFSWMNHRNSSDFYHSMPHRRITVYLCSVAAAATWIAGIICISSGVSFATLKIFEKYFILDTYNILPYIFGSLSASLVVIGAVAAGISLTGTPLNNVVVSAIFLYMPRYILTLVTMAITQRSNLFPDGSVSSFLSYGTNIAAFPVDYIGGCFGVSNFNINALFGTFSCIYTAILAVIYLAVAAVCFCLRKSESADHSAPSKLMQNIFRITVTMVICIPVCCCIFVDRRYDDDSLFAYLVVYIIAVVAYFSYELITTKKWRNLGKALPGLGIVVLLNVLFYGCIAGIYNNELNFTPSADDIDYFSMIDTSYDFTTYAETYSYTYYDYLSSTIVDKISSLRITDEDAKRAVSEALIETVENDKDSKAHFYYDRRTITVQIQRGLIKKYRRINVTGEQFEKISAAISKTQNQGNSFIELPALTTGNVYLRHIGMYTPLTGVQDTKAAMNDLYDTAREEIATVDVTVWFDYLFGGMSTTIIDTIVNTDKNITVPISPEITPITTKAYLELTQLTDVEMITEAFEDENIYDFTVYIPPCDSDDTWYTEYVVNFNDDVKDMIIDSLSNNTIDITSPFAIFSIQTTEYNDDGSIENIADTVASVPITEELASILTEKRN